jgi:hypothetical protein
MLRGMAVPRKILCLGSHGVLRMVVLLMMGLVVTGRKARRDVRRVGRGRAAGMGAGRRGQGRHMVTPRLARSSCNTTSVRHPPVCQSRRYCCYISRTASPDRVRLFASGAVPGASTS